MTEGNGDEKRAAERVPFYSRVTVRVKDEEQFIEKYSGNLSESGMFVKTRSPRPAGTIVTLKAMLKNGEHLFSATSVVKWIRESGEEYKGLQPGMGLKFLDIHPKDKEWLDSVLAKASDAEDDVEVEVTDPLA
ncbi:MAG: TIGR02266 family protein [Deltaproteobacteria bacterium]|nr:TIGR02266 family protein [Deltaproteobacteria bacterium]